jgi:hypothetical protein
MLAWVKAQADRELRTMNTQILACIKRWKRRKPKLDATGRR